MKINKQIIFNNKYYEKYKELIMYLIFGVLTTLVNIIVYFIQTDIFNIHYQVSNVIAWFISVTFAFATNKTFVFKSKKELKKDKFKEFISFYLFRVISLFIDLITMYILVDLLLVDDMVSKILSNVIVVIVNYVFSKMIIFKDKK